MDLWTEYEGKTIAGEYPLASLLRSEGRSAFFRIGAGAQKDAVLRLTEAHFDGEETMQRWRHVAGVRQDHLIAIRNVGQTTMDGVALSYAVLEPWDASLADVLAERPLTTEETLQVARAVVSALTALHSSGMVHEHIEAGNVLAVDETVKLRSDCVRECVIDQEFSTAEDCQQLRRRDVHDVGLLLLRCLTLRKEWQPGTVLPQPFAQVVPLALDGGWGLAQIASALDPPVRTPRPAAQAGPAAPLGATAQQPPLVPAAVLHQAAERPAAELPVMPPAAQFRPRNQVAAVRLRSAGIVPWLYGVGVLLLVLLGWHFLGGPSRPAAPAGVTGNTARPAPQPVATPVAAAPRVSAPAPIVHGWHVVAYTYNHEAQAAAKAIQIARKHAGLQPQVFSPSGHAPYFVALGGAMSSGQAESVLHAARVSGLPRDTFIRNF